jgi:hypothetical protein
MLVYCARKWVILCNTDQGNTPNSARERFTIAHELGHYHIPEHRRILLAGVRPHGSNAGVFDGAESVEELEADTFAANLLMPPSRFLSKLKGSQQTPLATVLELRQEFDTSLESTLIQALRHDPRMIAIAKWSHTGLEWHRISEEAFKVLGYRQFRLSETSRLPPDCATSCALRDPELAYAYTIRESVVTAAHCFDRVAAAGERNILIREEAIRNGRFGVVSLFSHL